MVVTCHWNIFVGTGNIKMVEGNSRGCQQSLFASLVRTNCLLGSRSSLAMVSQHSSKLSSNALHPVTQLISFQAQASATAAATGFGLYSERELWLGPHEPIPQPLTHAPVLASH